MPQRVLFVDDEKNILEGLRRMLRPLRKEWQMSFADSGEEALVKVDEQPFDVVVSDMRMPAMCGADLLAEVRKRNPGAVRIILSGHSSEDMVKRSIGVAHQYLAKPCDADALKAAVGRALALRDILSDATLSSVVSRLEALPSMPASYSSIMTELRSPEPSVERVAEIVMRDPAMTAKILQLVNSAFFGLRRRVSNPKEAVVMLGLETIRGLALSAGIFSEMDGPPLPSLSYDTLMEHSLGVAGNVRTLAKLEELDRRTADDAFVAGLLHDVGKLILARGMSDAYADAIATAKREAIPLWQAETEQFGCSHAEIGAYLLGLWAIPAPVAEAIANHHHPGRSVASEQTGLARLATLLHVADALHHEHNHGAAYGLDEAHLQENGFDKRLPAWRRACAPEAEAA